MELMEDSGAPTYRLQEKECTGLYMIELGWQKAQVDIDWGAEIYMLQSCETRAI